MSYEYHKHPKKNWGQPPAFRLPHADRTGSEKTDVPSPILNKRTVHVHMRQGGTGWYLFFPVFSFRGREHVGFGIPFLHGMRLLQVSLDFQGGVSAIFFAQPPFRSASTFPFFARVLSPLTTYPREGRRFVGSGTNGDKLRQIPEFGSVVYLDLVVWSRVDWNIHSLTCTWWWWLILALGPKTVVTCPTERRGGLD